MKIFERAPLFGLKECEGFGIGSFLLSTFRNFEKAQEQSRPHYNYLFETD